MANAPTTCARVLTALEDLVAQERAVLQVGDFDSLEQIQLQAGRLIEFLVARPDDAQAEGLASRLTMLHAARQENAASLAQAMAGNRAELRLLSGRQGLIARMAPAYGSGPDSQRQISLVA